MEDWRAFFSGVNADIWTIIQHAISLAALDFPKEFKEKRAEIAETLFDRRFSRSCMSVEVNEENPLEEGEIKDDSDCVDAEKLLTQRETEAFRDKSHREESLHRDIGHIKVIIDLDYQLETAVLNALQRLQAMQMTIEALKMTEIGKYVNGLRKHPSKHVCASAKQLVRHWKDLVDEWVCAGGDKSTIPANEEESRGLPDAVDVGSCANATTTSLPKLSQHGSFVDNKICGQENWLSAVRENISSSQTGSMLTDCSDKGSVSYTRALLRTPEEMWSTTRVDPLTSQMVNSPFEKFKHVSLSSLEDLRLADINGQSSCCAKSSKLCMSNNAAVGEKEQLDGHLRKRLHEGYLQTANFKKQQALEVLDLPKAMGMQIKAGKQRGQWSEYRRVG